MINRELIRLKATQMVYSYYLSEDREDGEESIVASQKNLIHSLDKAYDLYHALLCLLIEVRRVCQEDVENKQLRNRQLGKNEYVSTRLANNRLIQKLFDNEQLRDWYDRNNQFWAIDEETIKGIYRGFTQTGDYEAYLEAEDSFLNDKEAIRRLYRLMVCENEDLNAALEDKSIYWNDDKFIIDTFVMKTLKLFEEDTTPDMPLLPAYDRKDDLDFALKLHRNAIEQDEYYRSLIQKNSAGWTMDRIARMDLIILQLGIAELVCFPDIPVAVTINEYVNISKMYSNNRNWTFVNATLDRIAKELRDE